MLVTLDQVLAEAKKLSITLTDAQAQAHVTLNTLPVKGSSSSDDDDGGNGEGDDDFDIDSIKDQKVSDGVRKRINKLNEKRKAERKELTDARKKLQDKLDAFESERKKKEDDDLKNKGEHEKRANTLQTEIETLNKSIGGMRTALQDRETISSLRSALFESGCRREKLTHALKLVDKEIGFKFKDDKSFDFEIDEDAVTEVVEALKKDCPEFFAESDIDDSHPSEKRGWNSGQPPAPRRKGLEKDPDKLKDRLTRTFPALNRLLPK